MLRDGFRVGLITVANNTHLEGGLIANTVTDENGNLIDQGNLSLTTKTLTVSNLNNNHDSISMGGGINASASSASLSAQYGGEERKGLTQATIGQGALTITEGTEPENLNRELTQASIVTEEHKVGGLNANLTVDTRMFSEKGRAEIEKDFKQGGILIETAVDVATSDKVNLTDYNAQVGTRNNYFEAAMSFAAENPALAQILMGDVEATDAQKQAAQAAYVDTISNQFGISREEAVLMINTNATDADGNAIAGGHVTGGENHGTIYVNAAVNTTGEQTSNTLGHETAHYLEDKGAITVSGAGTEDYANIMGEASSDYFSFSYSNQNTANQQVIMPTYDPISVSGNTDMFSGDDELGLVEYRREQVSRKVEYLPAHHKAEIVARDSASEFDQTYIDSFGQPADLGNGEYGYVMEGLNKNDKLVTTVNDPKTLDAYKGGLTVTHNSDPDDIARENKLMDQYSNDIKTQGGGANAPDYPSGPDTVKCYFGSCGFNFYNSNTDADAKAQNAGYKHNDNPNVKVPGAIPDERNQPKLLDNNGEVSVGLY